MKNKRAVTLIELLLAVSLMGMIMLVAANVEVATRTFYFRSDRQGQLQVRLSAAMEHMVKNISLNHGDVNNPGINLTIPAGTEIVFRLDNLAGGVYTPQNYNDDVWMRYWRQGDQIMFCPNWSGSACSVAAETICTRNVTRLLFIPSYLTPPASYVEIILEGTDVDVPLVNLHAYVSPRAWSHN